MHRNNLHIFYDFFFVNLILNKRFQILLSELSIVCKK